jgi:hypothetical protein
MIHIHQLRPNLPWAGLQNLCCYSLWSYSDPWGALSLLEGLRCSITLLITAADSSFHGYRRIFGCFTLLSTIRQALDHIVWVAAVEEGDRVALFTGFVNDSVKIGDIFVVRPVPPSVRAQQNRRGEPQNTIS